MYNVYMVKNKTLKYMKPFKLIEQFDDFDKAKEFAIKEAKKRTRAQQVHILDCGEPLVFTIPINKRPTTVVIIDFGSCNETYLGIFKE